MSPEPDEDGDELLPERPVIGSAELADDGHEPHPAAWLYLPDLASPTGWSTHAAPRAPSRKPERRRIGFGR